MSEKKTGGEALKYVIVFAVLFAIGILTVWGMTGQFFGIRPEGPEFVEQGDLVTLNYTGWYDNGSFFESGILEFSVGSGRLVVESIGEAILGMKVNENRILNLTPELAFGEYDITFLFEQPRLLTVNSILTFPLTPEQFKTEYSIMPDVGRVIASVDLPWRRVEILNFTNTTMTWKLMPPEGLKTSWPLDCQDRNRAVSIAMDCYGVATMNPIEQGEKIEITIEPLIGEWVKVGGMDAKVLDADNENIYYLDFNHELAGKSFIYSVELLDLEKA